MAIIKDKNRKKRYSWIWWALSGTILIGIFATSIEINEKSYHCNSTQIAQVDGSGIWRCADLNTTTSTSSDDDFDIYFNTSIKNNVVWNLTESDDDNIVHTAETFTGNKYIFGGDFS